MNDFIYDHAPLYFWAGVGLITLWSVLYFVLRRQIKTAEEILDWSKQNMREAKAARAQATVMQNAIQNAAADALKPGGESA